MDIEDVVNRKILQTLTIREPRHQPGIYSLLIQIDSSIRIQSRKKHEFQLPAGLYIYTGSALGKGATNLAHRVHRHFNKSLQKSLFWHIDFLLHEVGSPVLCVYAETVHSLECRVVQDLKRQGGHPIPKFGSSDCIAPCGGHLLQFPTNFFETLFNLLQVFRQVQLDPHVYWDGKKTCSGSKPFIQSETL